jgi:lipopolysaccharide export LptBFGC system permease protein LptF
MKPMTNDIKNILQRLEIELVGRYENHFYIIPLADSNEYARMYTKLDKNAINTEYPEFTTNTNNSTEKVVNYFELDEDETTYNIFLFADFKNDKYYVKIGEK